MVMPEEMPAEMPEEMPAEMKALGQPRASGATRIAVPVRVAVKKGEDCDIALSHNRLKCARRESNPQPTG
jgi:hypothetical protein